ncbi:hypothetical protein QJS04_geneDACA008140 [Acorus gramineus]|uniref:Late embryogenesis abundant protein LEA-2 subgroup domain-containing protein n=1 Tax=Acorus gramineus TaxID=55184 RepID=A0AAV9AVY2_ACOGR|nr:hypothetical protein QJS04_geneDACA008140 [Acorus gramineus]
MAQPNPVLQKPPGYRDPNAPPPPPKPKQVVLPAAFRHQPPRKRHPKRCTCRFCCCLVLLGLLFLLFVVSVVGAVSFMWFQPRVPSFHLQSIVPVRLNVSSRADGTFVSARTVVRLLAYNPNSKIRFDFQKNKNGEDEVRYMVEVRTRLGLVVNGRRSGTVPVSVRCGWVSLREMERGEIPRCNINTLKW